MGLATTATKSTSAGLSREPLVGLAELLSDQRAVAGAHGVEEGQRHDVAAQAGQAHRPAVLIRQRERRCGGVDRVRRPVEGLGQDRVGVPVRPPPGPSGAVPTSTMPSAATAASERTR